MEGLLSILIFVGVIAVTALVFGIWIVSTVLRAILRAFGAIFFSTRVPHLPPMPMATRGTVCGNARCRAVNPDTARFCRRCGTELPQAQRVNVRRVAMW